MSGFLPTLLKNAVATVLRAVASPLTASGRIDALTVTTNSVSVTVTGYDTPLSTKPLTYAWTLTNQSSVTNPITAIDPAKSATAFSAANMARGEVRTAKAYCTATQAASGKSDRTPNVTITISRPAQVDDGTGTGGGPMGGQIP
jgi:hypothetical protein